jgi:hypothetical protein
MYEAGERKEKMRTTNLNALLRRYGAELQTQEFVTA